ncbi:escape protein-like protein 2 [Pseudovirgaria hyperparasitica]|uniref:Mitochondrial escape protein 2 n=1 Tax=Pseudovirgaria hyperparasitica TaxID=470096 RepID=A0A6A6W346_9PEZI|nr:escape protein-like protein 2 [Pseudovirgaria hyperparasitica]KAF2755461.1 escape protein-like protein 2 [Pseudovirgaria hyperparasitica]
MYAHVKPWRHLPRRAGTCLRSTPGLAGTRSQLWQQKLRAASGDATLEAGENESGHISQSPSEGIFFFENVYPLRLQWLLKVPFSGERVMTNNMGKLQNLAIAAADPVKVVNKAYKNSSPLTVTEVLPRLKEGGAFVKFTHDPSQSRQEIEETLEKYLRENQTKPWWNPFARIQASLVRGKPWVEDLYRLPTTRLRVEFLPTSPGEAAAELTQEDLYSFFRPYGKLLDIVSQESDSKVAPRFALVDFTSRRHAIMARNCMHGYVVDEAQGGGKLGTILRLSYQKRIKAHWIRDWLLNHPRIVIPAAVALLTGISIVVFDPLRTFSIKVHITRAFHIEDNKLFKWFKTQANDLISFHHKAENDGMEAIWDDRKTNIDQLKTWLMESADTFIIVQGPRGSGKRELIIDQALQHKKNKLIIDCKPIQEAHGDSATIRAAAAEVGYRPVFSWMNSISGMIDLAAQGAAGVKTGFSETLDNQLAKIWNNTASALRQIALDNRHRDDSDKALGDDEWLEAHPEKRPVVVIDNFLHKSQENNVVYDKIAEWAAQLSTSNIAHVIFLTNDVSFSKSLSKALPDRVFRQISLSDCSPEVAKRYVISHINADQASSQKPTSDSAAAAADEDEDAEKPLTPAQRRKDLAELDECISYLGGRLTDLEFLGRRIKAGETPKKAVQEMIEQSASEILKMYLIGVDDNAARAWSPEQAWLLVSQLARHATLRYNEVLLADTYNKSPAGGESALQALEQAELITILSANGRPHSIMPGKPIYHSAFQRLTADTVLRSKLDLATLTQQTKIESANIDKYEAELRLLSDVARQQQLPQQLGSRVQWLLEKVAACQGKIERYERESAALKKVLVTEY